VGYSALDVVGGLEEVIYDANRASEKRINGTMSNFTGVSSTSSTGGRDTDTRTNMNPIQQLAAIWWHLRYPNFDRWSRESRC
jgi:hypothetical protein